MKFVANDKLSQNHSPKIVVIAAWTTHSSGCYDMSPEAVPKLMSVSNAVSSYTQHAVHAHLHTNMGFVRDTACVVWSHTYDAEHRAAADSL